MAPALERIRHRYSRHRRLRLRRHLRRHRRLNRAMRRSRPSMSIFLRDQSAHRHVHEHIDPGRLPDRDMDLGLRGWPLFPDEGPAAAHVQLRRDPPSTRFTVTLTATTPGGSHSATADRSPWATRRPAPPRGGIHRPTRAGAPAHWTSRFTDESLENECPIASWSWDFGEARLSPPTKIPPTRSSTPAEPETYTIRLTVTSAGGSDFFEDSLVVDPAP